MAPSIREVSLQKFPVQAGDMLDRNTLRTLQFAGPCVGAVSEPEFVHFGHHVLCPSLGFDLTLGKQGERTHAGRDEQHGRAVAARRHACSAPDAGSGVHALLGLVVTDEDVIGILRSAGTDGNETACLQNLVEGCAVHHQILYNGEGTAAERLYSNGGSVLEMPHEQLAGGDMFVGTMGASVYIEGTGTADTLAAIVVERYRTAALAASFYGNGIRPFADKLFIEDIEHLQEGGVGLYPADMISLEMTLGLGVLLTPYLEVEFHNL